MQALLEAGQPARLEVPGLGAVEILPGFVVIKKETKKVTGRCTPPRVALPRTEDTARAAPIPLTSPIRPGSFCRRPALLAQYPAIRAGCLASQTAEIRAARPGTPVAEPPQDRIRAKAPCAPKG